MNRLLILCTILFCAFPAFAGREGGGGAGLVDKNGRLRSLAELGIQIGPNAPQFPLASETIVAVHHLAAQLEEIYLGKRGSKYARLQTKEYFSKVMIGAEARFIGAPSVPREIQRRVHADYAKFLAQFPELHEFRILAYSELLPECQSPDECRQRSAATYIFPGFSSVDARIQALYLLHESNIRRGLKLVDALRIDSLLWRRLNGEDSPRLRYELAFASLPMFVEKFYSLDETAKLQAITKNTALNYLARSAILEEVPIYGSDSALSPSLLELKFRHFDDRYYLGIRNREIRLILDAGPDGTIACGRRTQAWALNQAGYIHEIHDMEMREYLYCGLSSRIFVSDPLQGQASRIAPNLSWVAADPRVLPIAQAVRAEAYASMERSCLKSSGDTREECLRNLQSFNQGDRIGTAKFILLGDY